jgi:alpha-beta hydrolase superfamily lysophospholipase
MRSSGLLTTVFALAGGIVVALGASPGAAQPQPRAHVYLLRGLLNIFSLGMDSLADELKGRDVDATVHGYSGWQTLADQAAADYKAGKEAPIILIGHSLGADAVMEMAAYLGRKGVPVALVVPFGCTKSFAASDNVARVLNLTQSATYANVRGGPGFHGTLATVDVSSDPDIDHINIDKSPRLHARVVAEVLAVVGNHKAAPAKKGNGVNVGTARPTRLPEQGSSLTQRHGI